MAKVITADTLERQRRWSRETFGPGYRPGTIAHIRKELVEIEADPTDCEEWVDALILVVDGAMRAGHQPQDVIDGYFEKFLKNTQRKWPDWRLFSEHEAIEHVR